jgi:hypothetical protein
MKILKYIITDKEEPIIFKIQHDTILKPVPQQVFDVMILLIINS